MASSRRTLPAQTNIQLEWAQHPTEDTNTNHVRHHNYEQAHDRRDSGRKREISKITHKHLERVISTMMPSSTCSSLDPIESAPVNRLVTQPSDRDIEEAEFKQTPKEKEKPVIVNNYYISDRENGWKQLKEGEIPPNISENTVQQTSSEILPNKTAMEHSSRQQKVDTNEKSLNINQAIEATKNKHVIVEWRRYYAEEEEVQNMSPPTTHNLNYPPPVRPTGNSETTAMLDCIHQLQLTLQQHVLTNSKQAEYHVTKCRPFH